MFENKEVRFERRSILSSAQLRAMEKFPREFLNLYFSGYGDGILSGMDFVQRDEDIFLTEGILKLNDKIYFTVEENLTALAENCLTGESFCFALGDSKKANVENVIVEKILIEVIGKEKNCGLEFGNFASQMKFSLPYIDAENLSAEFTSKSRLNILNVNYAVRGGVTFHPRIFQAVLKKLTQKKNPSPIDSAFMIQLANFPVATIPALKIYVESSGVAWLDDSRENIFKSVLNAIQVEWKINLPEKISAPQEKNLPINQNNGGFFI